VKRASPREAVRAVLAVIGVVLALSGIPGARSHLLAREFEAPPVPAEVKDRDAIVEVSVRDASGALRGARVQVLAIIDDRAYLGGARETDASGRAHFEGLPAGEVWILADSRGHARGSSHAVVSDVPRHVAMTLVPEHTIDVAVHDDLGVPVAGAQVEAVAPQDDLPFGAVTGADGTAHVGRLPDGPWRLTARAPGYDEDTARGTHDAEVVRLTLRKLGAIVVHVAGGEAEGAPRARVAIAGATLWPARASDADDAGDVRIGGLPAGSYALRATRGAWVSPPEVGVALARGETKNVTLTLVPGRFVAVHVTDGDGDDADPIAGARLSLAESGLSPFPLEGTTDGRGAARLGPIAPGGSALGVRADGFVPRGGVIVADPPPEVVRVALVRAGVLTGRVVDSRGDPIDGATIEIVGSDPGGGPIFDEPSRASFQAAQFESALGGPSLLVPAGELGVVPGPVAPIPHAFGPFDLPAAGFPVPRPGEPWVTDADGEFRASPASPGRVRAVVHHPQYVEAESDFVTLAPAGEAHVDVVMRAGGALEGRVLDAHDMPVEGARVIVSALHGSTERTTCSARDGTFGFAALPDAVSLAAAASDDEEPTVRTTVTIPEGGRQEIVVHLPEPRDPLPVSVVDEGGWPVEMVQLSAVSLSVDSPLRLTAFTDVQGDAELRGARGLPLRVEARAPGHAPSVSVTDGTSDSLRIELAPAERASGEVVAARGRDPIASAEVTLYTDLGVRRARTDAQGDFTMAELAAGPARLRVRAAGFAPVTLSLDVPDSRGSRPFTVPPVELAEAGTVTGEVVDAQGDPIVGARVARDQVPTWLLSGSNPQGVAVTDAHGAFTLGDLAEGMVALEAYAPDRGRGRLEGVHVVAGRTTDRLRIVLAGKAQGASAGSDAPGSVAVTLGETGPPVEVVVVSVAEGSAAERAGLAPGDVLLDVDGAPTVTMADARARLSGPLSEDVLVHVRREDQTIALRVAREAVRR
jgi:hypothetical protein